MLSFVGRNEEQGLLQKELDRIREDGRGGLVWMRGRRRVGKSRLVQEFCNRSQQRYCFYQAPRRGREEALAGFGEAVRESTLAAAASFADVTYNTWPAALAAAGQGSSATEPAIVVIDELPYLVEGDPGFAADLQKAWDRTLENLPVLLICVGSDVRMMASLVEERAPLHGRPTREVRVSPLTPADVGTITGAADPAEALDRYLIVGGFPLLAAAWRSAAGPEEFLREALADDQTPFATTALRIKASEFESELQAARVIDAVGHGETAYNRIQSRSGVKGNTLTGALAVLIEGKSLVRKDLPCAVPPGRTAAKYTVVDPYLRFWLRFVGPHMDELSRGRSDLVVERIMRDWPTYRGKAVEPVVRVALERLLVDPEWRARLGDVERVGSWWRRDHSIEVDLVGIAGSGKDERVAFLGSIKWRDDQPFSIRDLDELTARRGDVPGAAGAKIVAVGRAGGETGLEADAIFGPAELLAAW